MFLWVWVLTIFIQSVHTSSSQWLKMKLPNYLPKSKDSQKCVYERLPIGIYYAVEFKPYILTKNIERIILNVCSLPRFFKASWDCNHDTSPCIDKNENTLFYSWSKSVQNIVIPDNVGFKLGSETRSSYIVMQVLFDSPETALPEKNDLTYYETYGDGVDVLLTQTWQKYLAGVYSFSALQTPILSSSHNMYDIDINCVYNGKKIAPFAYSCIADKDGESVSAYRVHNDEWSLISKANPLNSLQFYPIPDEKLLVIKPGDYLALKCKSKSKSKRCKFSFMYYMLNKNIPPHQYNEKCNVIESSVKDPMTVKLITVKATPSVTVTHSRHDVYSKSFILNTTHATPVSATLIHPTNEVRTSRNHLSRSNKHVLDVAIDHMYTGPKPVFNNDWFTKEVKSYGFMCSVSLGKNVEVAVLSQGFRTLTGNSFDDEHYYTDFKIPIKENTIFHIDAKTGKIVRSCGSNKFFLPHSLTIDHNNNYWITDIALHQVFKFSNLTFEIPSLTLGVATIPGSDNKHFCKPTDVSIDSYENIYVADGYCNSRIMKFDKHGNLLMKWGATSNSDLSQLITPHSLSIDNEKRNLYVSDLQTGNIIKFDLDGNVLQIMRFVDSNEKLYSINFNYEYGGMIYALSRSYQKNNLVSYIISVKTGKILMKWNIIDEDKSKPHDIISSPDNTELFILTADELLKFSIHNPQGRLQDIKNAMVDEEGNYYNKIKYLKLMDDDKSVFPAVIVVSILAVPVLLALITMLVQYSCRKYRHSKVSMLRMQKNGFRYNANNEILCYGCCITRKHYYDTNRVMDDLINASEDGSSEDEDLYTGKA